MNIFFIKKVLFKQIKCIFHGEKSQKIIVTKEVQNERKNTEK